MTTTSCPVDGEALDDDEFVDDALLDGGVPEELEAAPAPVDGVDVSGVVDELDDIEPLGDACRCDGGVVDDDDDVDGDGVTTGGVVDVVDRCFAVAACDAKNEPGTKQRDHCGFHCDLQMS